MSPSVEQIIQGLEETRPVGQYLYRGQSMIYPSASSTLARILSAERSNGLLALEAKNLFGAVSLYSPHTLDIEIKADLRHFGGPTNFIDFTRDPRIALFFACLGHEDEPGQVLCLPIDRGKLCSPWDYSQSSLYDLHQAGMIGIFQDFHMAGNAQRAIRQSSVMVHQPSGHLKFAKEDTYCIPAARKPEIREYLARKPSSIELHYLFPNKADFIELSRKSPEQDKDFEKKLDELLEYRAKQLRSGDNYSQGRALFFSGSYKEATDLFQAALRSAGRPDLGVGFYRFLSSSLLRTKKQGDALEALMRIPRHFWESEEYYMSALCKQQLGDLSGALADIERARVRNTSRSIYYITEIQIVQQMGGNNAGLDAMQRNYEDLFRNKRGEDSPLGLDQAGIGMGR